MEKYDIKFYSTLMNLSEEDVIEKVLPKMWACNAEAHVKAIDEAGIDKSREARSS